MTQRIPPARNRLFENKNIWLLPRLKGSKKLFFTVFYFESLSLRGKITFSDIQELACLTARGAKLTLSD